MQVVELLCTLHSMISHFFVWISLTLQFNSLQQKKTLQGLCQPSIHTKSSTLVKFSFDFFLQFNFLHYPFDPYISFLFLFIHFAQLFTLSLNAPSTLSLNTREEIKVASSHDIFFPLPTRWSNDDRLSRAPDSQQKFFENNFRVLRLARFGCSVYTIQFSNVGKFETFPTVAWNVVFSSFSHRIQCAHIVCEFHRPRTLSSYPQRMWNTFRELLIMSTPTLCSWHLLCRHKHKRISENMKKSKINSPFDFIGDSPLHLTHLIGVILSHAWTRIESQRLALLFGAVGHRHCRWSLLGSGSCWLIDDWNVGEVVGEIQGHESCDSRRFAS